jgi:hydrogenase-4 component F
MIVAILALPLAAALVAALAKGRAAATRLGPVALGGVLALGVALAARVVRHGPETALGGLVRADALSAFMVIVIGVVGLMATLPGARYLAQETGPEAPRRRALYGALVSGFVTAMLLAVLAANLGVMWVAIEATTVITTFLVGHRRTRASLEASWKYVIVCSVGIALAFLGTVLLYLAARHVDPGATLDWTGLVALAPHLDPAVTRLALALLIFGYGTKVGLAPLHSWLPDAHGQAPAPVSALMSGVLLSVALYALLRVREVAALALGPAFPRTLLVVAGLMTLVVATSMMIAQRDLKRLLAYSSMEHMGLCVLGVAAGARTAVAAVLFQVLGHGLVKATLFLGAGEILEAEGTTDLARLRGLLARRPALAGVLAAGSAALVGLPPFSLFASEVALVRALAAHALGWVAVVAVLVLAVVFAALARLIGGVLLGDGGAPAARARVVSVAPLVVALGASAILGIWAGPLTTLLDHAAAVVAP